MHTRREFLKAFSLSAASLASGAAFGQNAPEPYLLDMQRGKDRYLIDLRTNEGLKAAAWLLRDVQAGVIGVPNLDTLRLAAWTQATAAAYGQYIVLKANSGLRMPRTNARTEKAAHQSRHLPDAYLRFSAIDVDPIGMHLDAYGKLVAHPKFGGVGWYDTHIHFDRRERPAYWRG